MQDYLKWQSPLSLEQVFSSSNSFSYPVEYEGGVIYLTQLTSEKSRSALMFRRDDEVQCITPSPYNLRTKINEYGGKPFWLIGNKIYFCNQLDQCLYQQTLIIEQGQFSVSEPKRLTPLPTDKSMMMFSDVIELSASKLIAIVEYEDLVDSDKENSCSISVIDLEDPDCSLQIIEQGADFYSNLVFDAAHSRLAWMQWQHPAMPWDTNELYTAVLSIGDDCHIVSKFNVELMNNSACVCQLHFAPTGRLFFSADFKFENQNRFDDFWNIHCCDFDSTGLPISTRRVTAQALEFGYPHWQYGDSRIVQFDQNSLLTVASSPSGDQLFLIDVVSLNVTSLLKTRSTIQSLSSHTDGTVMMVELPSDRGGRLVQFENSKVDGPCFNIIIENDIPLAEEDVSRAQHIEFKCRDNAKAYGFYYPPVNSSYQQGAKAPPLIVMVHGGPTARAYGHFDIQKQFWTSRGFALFDVNHRGSSGYGRAYRDALYTQWGELDCMDVVDGIQHLIQQGKIDSQRICIRGKSAGGYAVLRALTEYPDIFKVGACYYGIGNLATLADTTHKFEKYYTDRLIGESYNAEYAQTHESLFYKRSPIHKVSKLKSAMIVFQGGLDKVVPPEVAHEVIGVLTRSGIDHEYVEYDDEAHGFRQVNNNIDAWTKELAFYRRILRD